MITARPILGGVFLAILLIGAIYAMVSPTLQPIRFPQLHLPWQGGGNNVASFYSLIRDTNVSSTVRFVTLNVTMKFGGIRLLFSNRPNLVCDVGLRRSANVSDLQASYSTSDGDQMLKVNLYAEAGDLNLTLGKNYQYGGNFDLRIGGMSIELGQNANVSRMVFSIRYFGALILNIGSGASFEELDAEVDIGGIQLTVNADMLERNGAVNANINIGGYSMGADVNTENVGVSLNSTVDIGALTVTHSGFQGPVSASHCSVKTIGYAEAPEKLDINAVVGLGGGTLQQSSTYQFWTTNP